MATIAFSVVPDTPGSVIRDSGDPLGFRSVATAIARDLVPGLTQATNLARGFSLLCLSLDVAASKPASDADQSYLRAERLWILAATSQGSRGAPLAGVEAARRLLKQRDPVPLTLPLLSGELASGLWGTYRRAATRFGLIVPSGPRSRRSSLRPSTYRLTDAGRKLVASTRRKVVAGQHLTPRIDAGEISLSALSGYRVTAACSREERKVLSEALGAFDRRRGPLEGAHRRLHQVWLGHGRTLHPGALPTSGWPEQHARAVRAAQAVTRLVAAYEDPFRAAAVEGKASVGSAVSDEDWAAIAAWDRTGVSRLRAELNGSRPPVDVLFDAHRRRAVELGREPWERGQTPEVRRTALRPDFALSAAASLYEEGMVPRG